MEKFKQLLQAIGAIFGVGTVSVVLLYIFVFQGTISIPKITISNSDGTSSEISFQSDITFAGSGLVMKPTEALTSTVPVTTTSTVPVTTTTTVPVTTTTTVPVTTTTTSTVDVIVICVKTDGAGTKTIEALKEQNAGSTTSVVETCDYPMADIDVTHLGLWDADLGHLSALTDADSIRIQDGSYAGWLTKAQVFEYVNR